MYLRRYDPRRLFLILKSKSYDVESSSYLDRREWLVLRFYVGTNSYFSTFFTFLRQTTCDGSFFVRKQFLGNMFSTFNHKIEIEIPDVGLSSLFILFLSDSQYSFFIYTVKPLIEPAGTILFLHLRGRLLIKGGFNLRAGTIPYQP